MEEEIERYDFWRVGRYFCKKTFTTSLPTANTATFETLEISIETPSYGFRSIFGIMNSQHFFLEWKPGWPICCTLKNTISNMLWEEKLIHLVWIIMVTWPPMNLQKLTMDFWTAKRKCYHPRIKNVTILLGSWEDHVSQMLPSDVLYKAILYIQLWYHIWYYHHFKLNEKVYR